MVSQIDAFEIEIMRQKGSNKWIKIGIKVFDSSDFYSGKTFYCSTPLLVHYP